MKLVIYFIDRDDPIHYEDIEDTELDKVKAFLAPKEVVEYAVGHTYIVNGDWLCVQTYKGQLVYINMSQVATLRVTT